jgi:hypothetical protein
MNTVKNVRSVVALAFKAVALGMAALAIAFTMTDFATLELYAIILGVGLFSLTVAAISDHPLI